MSQTAARGYADATRWVGVAASTVEYLDDWLAAPGPSRPEPPLRTVASVKRFLTWVLEGIAISRRSGTARHVPIMAALSSLTIAVEVLSALPQLALPQPGSADATLDAVERSVRSYVGCLSAIEEPARRGDVQDDAVHELQRFLRELVRRGNAARYAEFARGEQPVR